MNGLTRAYNRTFQFIMNVGISLMPMRKPVQVAGTDAVMRVPGIIGDKGISRVLVVTGGTKTLALTKPMTDELTAKGIACFVYSGTKPNPTIECVEEAREMYVKNGCEAIIAFGGGSPMDCAKAAGARVVKPNTPVSRMRGQLRVLKRLPLFIAIPTTAGTGSEATLAAVISNASTHEKYAINDPSLIPDYAVLDPGLTLGLPPSITAATGLDALTHAVEAYTNKYHTKTTTEMAEKAVKLIFENLEKAYADGHDMKARENMLVASNYAGVAFTRDMVGNVHAVAHTLGGMYGIAHGLANAVILPVMLDYYGETAHKRLAKLSDIAGTSRPGMSTKEKAVAFIDAIKGMNERMNIPKGFVEIREEDIPTMAGRALHEANPMYPVPKMMDRNDCEAIYRKLMK